jgi:hypothetical protein
MLLKGVVAIEIMLDLSNSIFVLETFYDEVNCQS